MVTFLRSPELQPMPLGSIRPLSWLARQLRIQADGISGHLDEFWPDIRDSRWFGGTTEAWERAPYWLDGLIPLAYTLDDADLKAKVDRYMDYIVTHQHDDGWLGPREMKASAGQPEDARYDLWAQLLATKVLLQYQEATTDPRVESALYRALRKIDLHIETAPLYNWGQFRWFEVLPALYWLYERTGEPWLLALAAKLKAQGFDWGGFFERWPLTEPTPHGRWTYMGHVVNNAMAVKAHGLWWRLSSSERDRGATYSIIEQLDRHHGMVTGIFSGDECLAGKSPTQGTELCAVVEYTFSLAVLASIFGDPAFGDRLEKVIFNALPATFSPDMWSHQYDQQVNQVECSSRPDRTWNTNGPDANLFGVEPNYGCCTANLSQGWPKFAANLWMRTPEGGIAAVAYAPSEARFAVAGTPVTVRLDTDYPFREMLRLTITAENPVRFPLLLRIPAWTEGACLADGRGEVVHPTRGSFHRIEQLWQGATTVDLTLPMTARGSRRFNGALSIERGPLVYALSIGENWCRVHEDQPYRELPHADWEVYPTTPWAYALELDEERVPDEVTFEEQPLGEVPFSPEGAPVIATVRARRLREWTAENGSAADVPPSPMTSDEPVETLRLIPYGCTNLRITEFPVVG